MDDHELAGTRRRALEPLQPPTPPSSQPPPATASPDDLLVSVEAVQVRDEEKKSEGGRQKEGEREIRMRVEGSRLLLCTNARIDGSRLLLCLTPLAASLCLVRIVLPSCLLCACSG